MLRFLANVILLWARIGLLNSIPDPPNFVKKPKTSTISFANVRKKVAFEDILESSSMASLHGNFLKTGNTIEINKSAHSYQNENGKAVGQQMIININEVKAKIQRKEFDVVGA